MNRAMPTATGAAHSAAVRIAARRSFALLFVGVLASTIPAQARADASVDAWFRAKTSAARLACEARILARADGAAIDELAPRFERAGWRGRRVLLRLRLARRELLAAHVFEALQHASWALRVEALAILNSLSGGDSAAPPNGAPGFAWQKTEAQRIRAAVRARLADESPVVRSFARRCADALGALQARDFVDALRRDGSAVLREACARAVRYPRFVETLLDPASDGVPPELRLEGLRLLDGFVPRGRARELARDFAADATRAPEARRRACLLLPASLWPEDVPALVLDGLVDAPDSSERLLRLAPPRHASEVIRRAIKRDAAFVLIRRALDGLPRADVATAREVLGRIDKLDPEIWRPALTALSRRLPKESARDLIRRFDELDANLRREVLAIYGKAFGASDAGRRLLLARLDARADALEPHAAEIAFKSLVAARSISKPVLDYVLRNPVRQRRLIGLRAQVPARFWLDRLAGESDVRLRWGALNALALYASEKPVARQLLAYVRSDYSLRLRRAALVSILRADQPPMLDETLVAVIKMKAPGLDAALLETLRESNAAWVARALVFLSQTRFHDKLPMIRAARGDAKFARRFLRRAGELKGSELRQLRASIAKSLRVRELDAVFALLRGESGGDADIWTRAEALEWLALRADLDVSARLRAARDAEKDPDLRSMIEAALVRDGDPKLLRASYLAWLESEDGGEDTQGVLLELMGALREDALGAAEVDFLLDLIFAPLAKDARSVWDFEATHPKYGVRVEAQYPLLRPALRLLARADAVRVRARAAACFASPRFAPVRESMPRSFGLRIASLVAAQGAAFSSLAPLIERAAQQRPLRASSGLATAVLQLLRARVLWESGRDASLCAGLAQRGVEGLLSQELPERVLERIARDVVPVSSAAPRTTLRAFAYATAAAAVVAPGRGESAAQRALALRACAEQALREDSRLRARLLR